MLRSIRNSRFTSLLLFIGALTTSTSSISQTTVENSVVITGKHAQVAISQIPKKELKKLTQLSRALTNTFRSANSFKAETALKNKNYALASDIWGDIAQEELLVKKSKPNWASAILKKSEAEEQYDIAAALKTIDEAIQKQPNSTLFLEKSAILSLSLHQLPKAKDRLIKLSSLLDNSNSTSALTKYLLHFRLWVVYASLGQTKNSLEQAAKASRIFNSSLKLEDQQIFLEDQRALYIAAILTLVDRAEKNLELLEEFKKTQSSFDAGNKTLHIAATNSRHWITIATGEVERISSKASLATEGNRFDNVEIIVGNYQAKLIDLINSFLSQAKAIDSTNSTAARKLFHKTYDDLIELSGKCIQCGEFAKRRHFASYLLGVFYFEIDDYRTANFFFSKALNEIRNADVLENYNAIALQATYLENISTARSNEFEWVGNSLAMITIHQPLTLALKNIDQILNFDPANGKALLAKIRLLNRLSAAHTKSFNFLSADEACEGSYDLYLRTLSNQKLADEAYQDFFDCQFHLIIRSGMKNDTQRKTELIERLTETAIKSDQIRSASDLSWLK